MKAVIVDSSIDKAHQCAESLKKDNIDIEKILIFKKAQEYQRALEEEPEFTKEYKNILEQIDLWNCFEKLDELYDKGNIFLMSEVLEKDGSDGNTRKSLSVIYAASKANNNENSEPNRVFIYCNDWMYVDDMLNKSPKFDKIYPDYFLIYDYLGKPFINYKENEEFCKLISSDEKKESYQRKR